ncbi:MAG: hypothetical protein GY869_17035, partial [Planctomycetes bacterium]|nr:hypothetical protein [Planctomycetota bacterium]
QQWLQTAAINLPVQFWEGFAIKDDVAVVAVQNSAYVYRYQDPNWIIETQLPALGFGYPLFTYNQPIIAIDNNRIVLGAPANNEIATDAGAVFVYRFNDDLWHLEQKITPSDPNEKQFFGSSVAVDGDSIIIGAPSDRRTVRGAAYIYHRQEQNWTQHAKFTGPDRRRFATAVTIDDDWAFAASFDERLVHVYHCHQGIWQLQQTIDSGENYSQYFGNSMAIDGNNILIGAYDLYSSYPSYEKRYSGSVYSFTFAGSTWNQNAILRPFSDYITYSYFGATIALDNNRALIGAPHDHEFGEKSGAAYFYNDISCLYNLPGDTNHDCRVDLFDYTTLANQWLIDCRIQPQNPQCFLKTVDYDEAKLQQSNLDPSAYFGVDIAMHGNQALVGAVNERYTGSAYRYEWI